MVSNYFITQVFFLIFKSQRHRSPTVFVILNIYNFAVHIIYLYLSFLIERTLLIAEMSTLLRYIDDNDCK